MRLHVTPKMSLGVLGPRPRQRYFPEGDHSRNCAFFIFLRRGRQRDGRLERESR